MGALLIKYAETIEEIPDRVTEIVNEIKKTLGGDLYWNGTIIIQRELDRLGQKQHNYSITTRFTK